VVSACGSNRCSGRPLQSRKHRDGRSIRREARIGIYLRISHNLSLVFRASNPTEVTCTGIHTAEVTGSIPAPTVHSRKPCGRCSSKLASGFSQGVGSTGDPAALHFQVLPSGLPASRDSSEDGSLGRSILVARGGAVESRPATPSDADAMASARAAGTFDSDQPVAQAHSKPRFKGPGERYGQWPWRWKSAGLQGEAGSRLPWCRCRPRPAGIGDRPQCRPRRLQRK
jgi:hypothetical protein